MALGLSFPLVDHGRNWSFHVTLFQKKEVVVDLRSIRVFAVPQEFKLGGKSLFLTKLFPCVFNSNFADVTILRILRF